MNKDADVLKNHLIETQRENADLRAELAKDKYFMQDAMEKNESLLDENERLRSRVAELEARKQADEFQFIAYQKRVDELEAALKDVIDASNLSPDIIECGKTINRIIRIARRALERGKP